MSLITKYIESFYDILLQHSMILIEAIPRLFKPTVVAGFVAVVSYTFYRIRACWYKKFMHISKQNSMELQEIRNYKRSSIRHRSIISHKEMLNNLEYAADNCFEKLYALKCIDIVVYCPHLLNVKSPVNDLTPFHRICLQGHTCLITFMLAKGGDPFITTAIGENALCMAVYYCLNYPMQNDFSCLEILHNTGWVISNVQLCIYSSDIVSTLNTKMFIFFTGCKFGFEDKWFDILLEMAFSSNHTKLMQWMILHHKDPLNNISRSTSTPY
ncbi:uncharacterized protein LOC128872722 isoform X1 [Hylaeus volcanicus]|uniref:uncharacterized protein LOC128872722 isoform X1 n=1 Tax=Hylaeus volcanicus TaxID=313075 RepID=UPI0023B7D683|nr:uncharacterized protein LOC128872722 isoform X1 [Hylaeus volcanicus]